MNMRSAKGFMVLMIVVLMGSVSEAQSWTQNKYCPGWNNPANFSSGNATSTAAVPGIGYYSAQAGMKSGNTCPNVLTGETGATWSTTYTAAQMDQGVGNLTQCYNSPGTSSPSHPGRNYQYRIMSETGFDPNTDNHLRYVPVQFKSFEW